MAGETCKSNFTRRYEIFIFFHLLGEYAESNLIPYDYMCADCYTESVIKLFQMLDAGYGMNNIFSAPLVPLN